MTGRLQPIGEPAVRRAGCWLMTDHDADTAVLPGYRGVAVDADTMVAVIKRFHPVVGQLEIPRAATLRRTKADQQGLLRPQLPATIVVKDLRVAAGPQAHLLVIGRQRIQVACKDRHPLPKQAGGPRDEGYYPSQLGAEFSGLQAAAATRIETGYAQFGGPFPGAIPEGLANQDAIGPGQHG